MGGRALRFRASDSAHLAPTATDGSAADRRTPTNFYAASALPALTHDHRDTMTHIDPTAAPRGTNSAPCPAPVDAQGVTRGSDDSEPVQGCNTFKRELGGHCPCGASLAGQRADARHCSVRCRVAAHRRKRAVRCVYEREVGR